MDKNKSSIDRKRLIYIPFLIVLFAVVIINIVTFFVSRNIYMEQLEDYAENLTMMLSDNIKDNQENLDRIIKIIDDKMVSLGNEVVMNRESVDSQYLKELCENFRIQEINLYNGEGEIIISTVDSLIGRKYEKGSPIDRFSMSSGRVMVEDIRKSLDSDEYIKSVFVRGNEGEFVQVVINAEDIYNLVEKYTYQATLDDFTKDETVLYGYVMDMEQDILAGSLDVRDYENEMTNYAGVIRKWALHLKTQ